MQQSGQGIDAARRREAVLVGQNRTAAETDVQLQAVLRSAHGSAVEHGRRLDVIERSIEDVVARQSTLGLDTPAGAAAFQRFLLQCHREILAVVEDARRADGVLESQVQALSAGYQLSGERDGGAADAAGGVQTLTRGEFDGVTGDAKPVILKPGELGPYGYREAVPGSGVWFPADQVSGDIVLVPPGELAPWGYERIGTTPDGLSVWWPPRSGGPA